MEPHRTWLLALGALLLATAAGCRTPLHMIEEGPGGPGTFRVAVLHVSSVADDCGTPEEAARTLRRNFEEAARLVRMAARAGARIVVTPEYINTGVGLGRADRPYVATTLPPAPTDRPLWEVAGDGVAPYLVDYARLGAETGTWIVTDVVERARDADGDDAYYNTMVAFDAKGRLVARYRKVNLYLWEYRTMRRGRETVSFDTPWGRFGMLLCFDVLWPQTWGELTTRHGCDFLVVQSYWEHAPVTGSMAMNALANLADRPVLWSNQRRLGLGGGAAVVRPWDRDTALGLWGPRGVVVANLPLPERLRDRPIDPDAHAPRMIAYR